MTADGPAGGTRPLPFAYVQCGPGPLGKLAFLTLLRGEDLSVVYKGRVLETFMSILLLSQEVKALFPVVHTAS